MLDNFLWLYKYLLMNARNVWQLEQMELEVRGLPPADRQKYQTRLKSYQAELATLEKELVSRYFFCNNNINSSLVLINSSLVLINSSLVLINSKFSATATSVQHFVQKILIAFIMFNKFNVFSKLNIEQDIVALLYQSMGQDDTVTVYYTVNMTILNKQIMTVKR